MSAFEDGCELPAGERSGATELSERQFHVEQRNADEDKHDGVRYEKRSTAVAIAQVWEPPDVAQTHRVAGTHAHTLTGITAKARTDGPRVVRVLGRLVYV